MKILIWIICLFLNALITTIFKENGIGLGAIPTVILYGMTILLATTLCKLWDKHKNQKLENGAIVSSDSSIQQVERHSVSDTLDVPLVPKKKIVNDDVKVVDNNTPNVSKHAKKQINYKTKYCSRCGSLIDSSTRVCSGCGKKYIKFVKPNKFSVTVIIMSLLIVFSIIINIVQYNKIDHLSWRETYLESQVDDLNDEIEELRYDSWRNYRTLNFYKDYAVLVNEYSDYYHTYGCEDFDESAFWIYNINAAEQEGYYACPKCH